MPAVTNLASFSSRGFTSTSSSLTQYVASFYDSGVPGSSIGNSAYGPYPGPLNVLYTVPRDGSFVPSKLDNVGALIYNYSTTLGSVNAICVDNAGNIYIGGTYVVSSHNVGVLTKYDSNANILWSKQLTYSSITLTSSQITSIKVDSNNNVYIRGRGTGSDNATNGFIMEFNSSGTVLAQSTSLLNSVTSTGFCIDNNDNIIVAGFTNSAFVPPNTNNIYNVVYTAGTWPTTSGTHSMFSQVPNTGSSYSLPTNNSFMVARDGYLYQLVYRDSVMCFTKMDITTGTLNFSKSISFGGTYCELSSITVDASNNIYVLGNVSNKVFIGKFSNTDGSCIWAQTIYNSTYFPTTTEIYYYNGYLYFGFFYVLSSSNRYSNYSRISTNGVTPGTYGLFTFATISPTVTNNNTYSYGSELAIPLTTTFLTSTVSPTRISDSLAVNTVAIP